jgi:hypothetical protein
MTLPRSGPSGFFVTGQLVDETVLDLVVPVGPSVVNVPLVLGQFDVAYPPEMQNPVLEVKAALAGTLVSADCDFDIITVNQDGPVQTLGALRVGDFGSEQTVDVAPLVLGQLIGRLATVGNAPLRIAVRATSDQVPEGAATWTLTSGTIRVALFESTVPPLMS